MPDTDSMNVSGSASYYNQLASMATSIQSDQTSLELSSLLMKKMMDSQDQQGEALLKMISQTTTSLEGAGKLVNLQV
jgi:hypothetical protein